METIGIMHGVSTKPGELTMQLIRQLEKKYKGTPKENIREHIDELLYGKKIRY